MTAARRSCTVLASLAVAGPLAAQPAAPVPQGMVSFFATPGGQACPSGWKEAGYAAGRLILAAKDGSRNGSSQGEPMADQQPPLHVHAYSGNASVASKGTVTAGGSDKGVGAAGSYATSGTSDPADIGYPFVQYLACEFFAGSSSASGDAFPYGSFSFFNTASCPNGWSPSTAADGRFVLAMPAGGTAGTASQAVWSGYSAATHTHGFSGSVRVGSKGFVWGGGLNESLAAPGSMPLSGSLAANAQASPVVPFVVLLACQKTAFTPSSQGLPLGISTFFGAQQCPDGWGNTLAAPGRFFVAIGGTGTQGAAFGGGPMGVNESSRSHGHAIGGSITITEHDTDLTETWHNLHLGQKGSWSYSAASSADGVALPFIMLQACTYSASAAR
ncbi:hypothetical protein [Caldimonas sp. KR1-144]|uniref:hypothetical protein n=1 Tax=Caldimonas sp. KR1-144 TaxID=3400911 RepID=UPI003C016E41